MPARRLRRAAVSALAAVAVAVLVAACSNSEATVNKRPHSGRATASTVDGVQQVDVITGPDLRFHPSTIVVHQGKVRIVLENQTGPAGGPPHDLLVQGLPGAYVPLARANQTQQVTFTAGAPGRYTFVCKIHALQGQTGVLIVLPGGAAT